MIAAAKEFDVAIRQKTAQVARAVKPLAGYERRLDETLRGQLRPVKISGRHSLSANPNLSSRPDGQRVKMGVQYIHLGIGNRPTNGNLAG